MIKCTTLSENRKFQNAKRNTYGDYHNEKEHDPSDSILSSIKIIDQQFEKIYPTIKVSAYANQLLKAGEFEIELRCMKDFLFKPNKTLFDQSFILFMMTDLFSIRILIDGHIYCFHSFFHSLSL
jgi:hypothetical protein